MQDKIVTHLFYTSGGSNKEYIAVMECTDKVNQLWRVHAKYGPRHQAYNETLKVEGATYEAAKKEFLGLLKAKIRKGYTTQESGIPSDKLNWENEIAHVLLTFQFEKDIAGVQKRRKVL
jgi:predicted DNA-binding WGR domain protein